MSNTRKRKHSVDTDNQAQELPTSTSSSTATMLSTSLSSTSVMFSTWRSSAEIETKEEKEANGREEKHSRSPIATINEDVAENVALYLTHEELAAVLQTNKNCQLIFTPSMMTFALRTLCQAIVDGNYKKVEKIITSHPELLLKELKQKEPLISLSGQKSNNVTPYRAALAVEDTQMAAFIKNKMVEQKAGELADQQFREQFPAGWEAEEEKRWAPVFEQLETLTQEIRHANLEGNDITSSGYPNYQSGVRDGSAVGTALAQFRSLLDARLNETVTTGRHCNPHLLLAAFRIYDQHYLDYFGGAFNARALLFYQRVIGTIQRVLPVNYIQAFCADLDTTAANLQDNTPQGRSLTIHLYDPSRLGHVSQNFYPLAKSRLGFEWAAGWAGHGSAAGGSGGDRVQAFRTLISIKNSMHADIHTPAPKR